jgi:hypothetical protein
MQLKILKSFNYGSVSDPQKMTAGNTVETGTMNVAPWMIEQWIRHGWAEVIE